VQRALQRTECDLPSKYWRFFGTSRLLFYLGERFCSDKWFCCDERRTRMNPETIPRNNHGAAERGANSSAEGFAMPAGQRIPVIETRELRKVFGEGAAQQVVLGAVELSVREGEMIAIVGPSGSGKSTLLHLLAALDTPTSGTVYFRSRGLQSFPEAPLADYRNRSVGFVWQRHHLLPDFTAAENVAMPLLMRGMKRAEALNSAAGQLEQVGLASKNSQRAGELSGGEQQRVAIARALVNQPALLLADEPTGDLDERNADAVFDLMQRLHRTHRLTSILATHNRALAERCDRVLSLEHGELKPLHVGSGIQPVN
jgi:lipoprotein-releasing system ATP-binding protein